MRRNGLCGSMSSQCWTEPSAQLAIFLLSLWLSDHSFAVISPFSPNAKTGAILEARLSSVAKPGCQRCLKTQDKKAQDKRQGFDTRCMTGEHSNVSRKKDELNVQRGTKERRDSSHLSYCMVYVVVHCGGLPALI